MKKVLRKQIMNCHLCNNPPCASACDKLDLNSILLGTWLCNDEYIASMLPDVNPCSTCKNQKCKESCLAKNKINIKELVDNLYEIKKNCPKYKLTDKMLEIDFFGKKLENPYLLSSSCVGSNYEMVDRAFKAGWAGVCFKTITYLTMHEASPRYSANTGANTFVGFKNIEQLSQLKIEQALEIFRKLKKNWPNKILIASIMGDNIAHWKELAKKSEEAGADCLELNFSCPNMEEGSMGMTIGLNNDWVYNITKAVKESVKIPVLVKPTPNVSDMVPAALAAKKAGADGFACINTVMSLEDIAWDEIKTASCGGLSGQAVRPIALRFISDIKLNKELKDMYISGMGGIESWSNALNFLVVGANSLQVTTSIMEYGYRIIDHLKTGLQYYIASKKLKSVKDLVGRDLYKIVPLDQRERDVALLPQFDKTKCVGCGRCVISCADAGHQALSAGKDRKPILNPNKCVGCQLCNLVCPNRAIKISTFKKPMK